MIRIRAPVSAVVNESIVFFKFLKMMGYHDARDVRWTPYAKHGRGRLGNRMRCFSSERRRLGGLLDRLQASLDSRASSGKLRTLLAPPAGLVDFASNDYLGLARSVRLAHRVEEQYSSFLRSSKGSVPLLGSTGSRLLTGNNRLLMDLESYIAQFHGFSHCLIANSGWDLNYGLCSSVASSKTVVLYDELCHNSLLMGLRASRAAQLVSFRHNCMEDLRSKLSSLNDHVEKLVVVESVYSMDGDVCPVHRLLGLSEDHNALVLVDEAHSFGVFGSRGEGLVSGLGLQESASLLGVVNTYGKACGYHGASLVTQHRCLVETLLNYSKPLIYSTAMPVHSSIALRACYEEVEEASAEREKLNKLIKAFRSECRARQLAVMDSESHIQGVLLGGNERVRRVVLELREAGFDCLAIRAPTVPEGKERIRIILHAHNSVAEVLELCRALELI